MEKESVVLIGGEGFLGRNLKETLEIDGKFSVYTIDRTSGDFKIDLEDPASTDILLEYFRKFKEIPKIVLLASHIGAVEFNDNGIALGWKNNRIMTNINTFLEEYSKLKNKPLEVFFYSTSEVYGSLSSIDGKITIESDTPKVSQEIPRFRYSCGKRSEENSLKRMYNDKIISHLVIFRPFNVSGRYQRRGVLFKMLKDAIKTGTIVYSGDTTRTITPVGTANMIALEHINRNTGYEIVNMADPRFSITMEHLAELVKDYMRKKHHKICCTVAREPDKYIRYRHVSALMEGFDSEIMESIIDDVYREVVSSGR